MAQILVIDDDPGVLELIVDILEQNQHEVTAASDGELGISKLENDEFDIVFTDYKMPGLSGMDILDYIVSKSLDTKCIILTGHGSIKGSVEAMKKGAYDYITKPISVSEILIIVEKALKLKSLEEENLRLKRELSGKYKDTNLIGTSNAINKIKDMIDKVADTDGTILITGASGTGKELIAKSIHYQSSRSNKPMVVINCGAIPEELLESELFGHEKGAFTGAYKTRIGRFEMANGGSIFLDEIGEMSPMLQVKLLRVLQEKKFERVGGTRTIHVDLRIIAATNKNLTEAINNGTFREDLYYRLNVIPIKVPPLKQRIGDIPLMIEFFLNKFQSGKKHISGIAPDAMEAMLAFSWPGNVRELKNVIHRLTILCENSVVTLNDLPENIREISGAAPRADMKIALNRDLNLRDAVMDYEKQLILEALEKSNWVKSKAAKLLNIKRTTLVEKIKKQNIEEGLAS